MRQIYFTQEKKQNKRFSKDLSGNKSAHIKPNKKTGFCQVDYALTIW